MRTSHVPDLKSATVKTSVVIDFPKGQFADIRRVVDVEPVFIRLGSSGTDTTITLDNTTTFGERIDTLWDDDYPVNGSSVIVNAVVEGVSYRAFTGIITGVSEWNDRYVKLECASIAEKYRRLIGTTLKKGTLAWTTGTFPNLPDENVGRIMPWVWGTINGYRPVLVDDDQVTELTQAALTTDTTIYVASTDGFSSTGTLRINDEKMTYTGTTDTTFTGLTRGASGTTAGSHVAGNQVMEVGALVYVVANHVVSSIDNIRYINDAGIEVPVSGATTDLGGTYGVAYFYFDEIPTVEVPTTTHKLKLHDYDTVTASSNCDNPTYALGLHADWSEYNYATMDNVIGYLQAQANTAIDPPNGSIIRAWFVVEYWKDSTVTTSVVWAENGGSNHSLGSLPTKTNTPHDLQEDNTVWLMSSGFEDQHIHELDGEHAHSLSAGNSSLSRPNCDDGEVAGLYDWGIFPEAYDNSETSYATIDLHTAGYQNECFMSPLMTNEAMNVQGVIKAINVRALVGRPTSGTSTGTVAFKMDNYLGGGMVGYYKSQSLNPWPYPGPEWVELSGGWDYSISDGGNICTTNEIASSAFMFRNGNTDIDVYDCQINLLLDQSYYSKIWEFIPCNTSSPYYPYTTDMDWGTTQYISASSQAQWGFTSVPDADPKRFITHIMPAIAGKTELTGAKWSMQIKEGPEAGSPGTVHYLQNITVYSPTFTGPYTSPFGNSSCSPNLTGGGTTVTAWNVSSYKITGNEILNSCYLDYTPGGAFTYVNMIGIWVLWEDASNLMTGTSDVGDPDQMTEASYSSMGWFDVSSYVSDWTDFNTATFQIDTTSAGTLKLLRCFHVGEFAPRETRAVKDIACDVTGRTGTSEQILTDVLTEYDLLGIPAANVSIPSMSDTRDGALTEQEDGLAVLDRVLDEAACHGFWNFEGVFTVTARPTVANLATAAFTFGKENVVSASRSVKDIDELVNYIEAQYNYDFIDGIFADSVTSDGAASQAKYGKEAKLTTTYQFIRDETEAQTLTDLVRGYLEECWQENDLTVTLVGMNAEPGDTYTCNALGLNTTKGEIKEVRIIGLMDNTLTVEVRGVRYA